jgi:hypothetical protein
MATMIPTYSMKINRDGVAKSKGHASITTSLGPFTNNASYRPHKPRVIRDNIYVTRKKKRRYIYMHDYTLFSKNDLIEGHVLHRTILARKPIHGSYHTQASRQGSGLVILELDVNISQSTEM